MNKDLKKYSGKVLDVIVFRRFGIYYPKMNIKYELNYGYLTCDEKVECYVLGKDLPLSKYSGKCIAITSESKLVISNNEYSDEEIIKLLEFQGILSDIKIIR